MRRNREKKRGWFDRRTISGKITLMYGGIFAIAIFVIGIVIIINIFLFYRDTLYREMQDSVDAIARFVEEGNELTEETIARANPSKYVEVQVILLPHGVDLMRGASISLQMSTAERTLAARRPMDKGLFFDNIINSFRFISSERFVRYANNNYLIRATRIPGRDRRMLETFVVLYVIFNIAGVFMAFFVGRYISKKMLRPITDMIALASEISIEDLSRKIDISGPDDEIKRLAVTFNDMIGRLGVSFQKQSQFISDASHELRTPISVIQGYANLIDRWGKDDPDILSESISSIKAETEHMSMLVKKLLFLAGDDKGKKQLQMNVLLINSCLREIEREVAIMELPHTIEIVEKEQVGILGDYDLIKQMFWVFIENSMKYCRDGKAVIHIEVDGDGEKGIVRIRDRGIGIKQEDVPFVFERFYRGDKSRSKEIPGTGLGLSIADWILKRHEASASLASEANEGCEFTLTFAQFPREDGV